MNKWFVDYVNQYDLKLLKSYLSFTDLPCSFISIRGTKIYWFVFYVPKNKYSQTKYIFCHFQPVYKMLTWLLSSGLGAMVSFWWRWSLKIVAIWVDLNYSRRPQLFRLRLKLKSIPQRPLRFVEELSCSYNIIVAFVELFYHRPKPDPISGKRLYQNQDCIFSYARTFTYCVLLKINFIVPHFIHSIAN